MTDQDKENRELLKTFLMFRELELMKNNKKYSLHEMLKMQSEMKEDDFEKILNNSTKSIKEIETMLVNL